MGRHPCKRKSTQEEGVEGPGGDVEVPRPVAEGDWAKIRSTGELIESANSPGTLGPMGSDNHGDPRICVLTTPPSVPGNNWSAAGQAFLLHSPSSPSPSVLQIHSLPWTPKGSSKKLFKDLLRIILFTIDNTRICLWYITKALEKKF